MKQDRDKALQHCNSTACYTMNSQLVCAVHAVKPYSHIHVRATHDSVISSKSHTPGSMMQVTVSPTTRHSKAQQVQQ